MFNRKITIFASAITTVLLSGCAGGGGGGGGGIALPAAPAPGTPGAPVTTQPAANTFYSPDAVTVTNPVISAGGAVTATTGSTTSLGITTFTATLTPGTLIPTSATTTGGVNTSVPVLTQTGPNTFAGLATNGQNVIVGTVGPLIPGTPASPAAGLFYSGFGIWSMSPPVVGATTQTLSVFAGGTQFTLAMPVAGSATYSGITTGYSHVTALGITTVYSLGGNLALNANFATKAVTGNITGMVALDNSTNLLAGGFNNVALAGTINSNAFSGTATAGAAPIGINPAAIAPGTAGTTAGHFYGPAANEVTGVWSMSAGGVQVINSFGAKQ